MKTHPLLRRGQGIARWATAASAVPMLALALAFPVAAAPAGDPAKVTVNAGQKAAPSQKLAMTKEATEAAVVGPAMHLVVGKSTLLRLPAPIDRMSVGNPTIADVTLISPRELYLLGKVYGSTNIIMWRKGGATTIVDVFVDPDVALLQDRLHTLLPGEKDIKVSNASDSIVLSGVVSSSVAASQAVEIAEAFIAQLNRGLSSPIVAGNPTVAQGTAVPISQATGRTGGAGISPARVVNMMKVAAAQQVMLEVKVAEVQKTLLDKLGAQVGAASNGGGNNWTYSILSSFLSNSPGALVARSADGLKRFTIDASKKDGLIKILAEPNIVAISGQEASFLAGGKIFLPVSSSPNALTGATTVTLEEKEFGVGLKFTPTVLDGGRINLKVAPEVSELSQTGTPFTTIGNVTAVLPSMTTRRAQTTVQLMDGQSLAIAGLIKNNVTESVNRFPVLGEIPILGALFRSSEFQNDKTELMFVITPRLIKPLAPDYALPTDSFVPPSRGQFFLGGEMEGTPPDDKSKKDDGAPVQPSQPATQPPAPPAEPADKGGFEVK
ncbi:MAG TPA: type II and III secretion system protein family protein [Azospira sp.]|nr:type II and III secretion system protein family protein [Azospira sp.]